METPVQERHMGKSTTRCLTALALFLALPVQAQETPSTARYQINYKRFTRGKNGSVQDEPGGRLEWFRERMGGDLGADFADRLLTQAELERARYPTQFPSGAPLRPLAAGGSTWVSLGPTSSNFTQNGIQLTKVDSGRLRVILPDPADLVTDIKVDSSQAQDIVLVGTNAGLFRSVDGGASYAAVATATGLVWSLAKTSAGWLLNTVASNGAGSLLLSTDLGATWSPITNAGAVYAGAGRSTLAVGLPGDAVVYAFAAKAGTAPFGEADQQDLYRSTNGGQTWTALGLNAKVATNGAANTDQPNMDLMHGQAWYNQMILVDPSDSARNTVYLGGNLSSAKSTDGGTTWTIISNWLPGGDTGTSTLPYVHADFHCAAFSNLNGGPRLYFGGDGGLFTSADAGSTWDDTKNKGLVNHLLYSLVSNPATVGSAF